MISQTLNSYLQEAALNVGDCGSWIVDTITQRVYGHVVAVDLFGEAYVVPLEATFRDMETQLAAKSVGLPDKKEIRKWQAWHRRQSMLRKNTKVSHIDNSDVVTEGFRIYHDEHAPQNKTEPSAPAAPQRSPNPGNTSGDNNWPGSTYSSQSNELHSLLAEDTYSVSPTLSLENCNSAQQLRAGLTLPSDGVSINQDIPQLQFPFFSNSRLVHWRSAARCTSPPRSASPTLSLENSNSARQFRAGLILPSDGVSIDQDIPHSGLVHWESAARCTSPPRRFPALRGYFSEPFPSLEHEELPSPIFVEFDSGYATMEPSPR